MPTLDDLPTLPTRTLSGNEFIPVSDPDAVGGTQVGKLPVNAVLGLAPTDVVNITNTGTNVQITSRLSIVSNASTASVMLPSASGQLREVIIMRPVATALTVNPTGSEKIMTAAAVDGTSATLANSSAGRFLSDGTKWYHVSNDVAS